MSVGVIVLYMVKNYYLYWEILFKEVIVAQN